MLDWQNYPRDLKGYGQKPPEVVWPKSANVAVQFVVNYEEGGENCILHGDEASEAFLSEIVGAAPWPGQRHMNMESIYEYGSRVGFWRLWRLFQHYNYKVTVFAVTTALARYPEIIAPMKEAGWDIATHGWKWIDYRHKSRIEEGKDLEQAYLLHQQLVGEAPRGIYTGRTSEHSVYLVRASGQFDWCADSYADEIPYWLAPLTKGGRPQLMIPYTLDANDMRFATPQGFNSGDQFYSYLKDSFDCLRQEGQAGMRRMMSVGLHCRLIARPGRIQALAKFLAYIQQFDDVWVCTRQQIADHWRDCHPYQE